MYKLGIIGLGKMGGSILKGIINSSYLKKNEILLCLHSLEHEIEYKENGYETTTNVEDIYTKVDLILLATKPQTFQQLLTPARKYDFKNKGVISIAAGITISYLEDYFMNASIIRAMPNTPALIGKGVTTIAFKNDSKFIDMAKEIFSSIGTYEIIKENQMDETLPLNGSMPAYLYYFAKCFIDNAVSNDIDYDVALKLTANSIISSALMILNSKDDIDTLIKNVCSKGGTTIEGLNQLDDRFKNSIIDCYNACVKRSKELSK